MRLRSQSKQTRAQLFCHSFIETLSTLSPSSLPYALPHSFIASAGASLSQTTVLNTDIKSALTYTNVLHAVVTFPVLHWIKGSADFYDQVDTHHSSLLASSFFGWQSIGNWRVGSVAKEGRRGLLFREGIDISCVLADVS